MAVRTMGRILSGTKPQRLVQQEDAFDPNNPPTNPASTNVPPGFSTVVVQTGGSGDSGRYAYLSALEKIKADQAAAAAATERATQGARAQEAYLRGQLGAGIPSMITGQIDTQEKTGQQFIQDQAKALLAQLQERKGQATGLTETGYSNLMNYLARNQPTAFAQAQRVMPTITETGLGQYMAGQGVSPAAAQEAARLANIQAAGGASNYNQLLNVLAAREQAGQTSRQAEAEMGLAGQLANLQAIYGAGTSSLEQQRLAALQELATVISNARIQASREQAAREQAIKDALAALYGTGYVNPPVQPSPAEDTLSAITAGKTPNPGVDALLELIAQAQQSPTYSGGGGGGGGLPIGNAMVAL